MSIHAIATSRKVMSYEVVVTHNYFFITRLFYFFLDLFNYLFDYYLYISR